MKTGSIVVKTSRVRLRVSFYAIMSIALVALVAFGFSHTVPDDFSTPGFPPFLAVHGVVFAAWMLLFVAQPVLVAAGATGVHRKLGWVGLALAVAMVGLGGYAILFGLWSGQLPPFYPHGLFLIRGMIALATFFGLVIAAIANRRRPQWHSRLLLCATIVVTLPALERSLPLPLFGAGWPFVVDGVADTILLIGPAVDLLTRSRVHPAYIFGVSVVVLGQIATDVLAPSPIATGMLRALGTH
jgi:FtsH-binding integral membrane protein